MAERTVVSTRLDKELIRSAKHLAVDLNRPLNDILEEAIRDVLKKYKRKASPTPRNTETGQ
jgi:predicted transcriptional regulator